MGRRGACQQKRVTMPAGGLARAMACSLALSQPAGGSRPRRAGRWGSHERGVGRRADPVRGAHGSQRAGPGRCDGRRLRLHRRQRARARPA
eukprot:scaffold10576_cov115-Isochrysis_galbana.AAC.1